MPTVGFAPVSPGTPGADAATGESPHVSSEVALSALRADLTLRHKSALGAGMGDAHAIHVESLLQSDNARRDAKLCAYQRKDEEAAACRLDERVERVVEWERRVRAATRIQRSFRRWRRRRQRARAAAAPPTAPHPAPRAPSQADSRRSPSRLRMARPSAQVSSTPSSFSSASGAGGLGDLSAAGSFTAPSARHPAASHRGAGPEGASAMPDPRAEAPMHRPPRQRSRAGGQDWEDEQAQGAWGTGQGARERLVRAGLYGDADAYGSEPGPWHGVAPGLPCPDPRSDVTSQSLALRMGRTSSRNLRAASGPAGARGMDAASWGEDTGADGPRGRAAAVVGADGAGLSPRLAGGAVAQHQAHSPPGQVPAHPGPRSTSRPMSLCGNGGPNLSCSPSQRALGQQGDPMSPGPAFPATASPLHSGPQQHTLRQTAATGGGDGATTAPGEGLLPSLHSLVGRTRSYTSAAPGAGLFGLGGFGSNTRDSDRGGPGTDSTARTADGAQELLSSCRLQGGQAQAGPQQPNSPKGPLRTQESGRAKWLLSVLLPSQRAPESGAALLPSALTGSSIQRRTQPQLEIPGLDQLIASSPQGPATARSMRTPPADCLPALSPGGERRDPTVDRTSAPPLPPRLALPGGPSAAASPTGAASPSCSGALRGVPPNMPAPSRGYTSLDIPREASASSPHSWYAATPIPAPTGPPVCSSPGTILPGPAHGPGAFPDPQAPSVSGVWEAASPASSRAPASPGRAPVDLSAKSWTSRGPLRGTSLAHMEALRASGARSSLEVGRGPRAAGTSWREAPSCAGEQACGGAAGAVQPQAGGTVGSGLGAAGLGGPGVQLRPRCATSLDFAPGAAPLVGDRAMVSARVVGGWEVGALARPVPVSRGAWRAEADTLADM
ncbi:hypothetical protein HYH03_000729 [Edaphochlamys debaryana]|uniref:Uncharacterized protein n=1 Tax=Edaphochlamys debaryana TaxID=47281 RepID=A0A836C7G7_9CHLO|nr:hypothetical protein HYH03_000729 [Edaphochlamys debaryana]|eukprot:KAG2502243.1 hypothetical protein HYH03_000729 [Edaphochlamys debaryana]